MLCLLIFVYVGIAFAKHASPPCKFWCHIYYAECIVAVAWTSCTPDFGPRSRASPLVLNGRRVDVDRVELLHCISNQISITTAWSEVSP